MHTMNFYIVLSIGGFTFTYNQCQKGSQTSCTIYGIQGTEGTQVNYLGKAQLFLTRDQTEMSPRVPHNESPLWWNKDHAHKTCTNNASCTGLFLSRNLQHQHLTKGEDYKTTFLWINTMYPIQSLPGLNQETTLENFDRCKMWVRAGNTGSGSHSQLCGHRRWWSELRIWIEMKVNLNHHLTNHVLLWCLLLSLLICTAGDTIPFLKMLQVWRAL